MSDADLKNVLSFIGLCARARGLVSGETAVLQAIEKRKAHLVLLATDASANARKRYEERCAPPGSPHVAFATAQEMGYAIGKNNRVAIAVTDMGFAGEIQKRVALLTRKL